MQNSVNVAALHAALNKRMPLVLQVSRESDIRQAVRLADDYHMPLIVLGGAEAWRCADLLAAHKAAVVVDPEADLPFNFDELGARADSAAILQHAGVTIAFTVSGNTIHLSHNAGEAVREAAVKNADETSWKKAGKLCWLWAAATVNVVAFVIHARRSAAGLSLPPSAMAVSSPEDRHHARS